MKNHTPKSAAADLMCIAVAVIWGSGFIASQFAIDANMSSSVIMAFRFVIAALVMLAISAKKLRSIKKEEWLRGMLAGVFLFCAFYSQIFGQTLTTVSHSAFLTATNVVMVPFLVWIATRKAPPVKIFILAGTTLAGIGILTLKPGEGLSLNAGDLIMLVCAVFFALHIFYLGRAVRDSDPVAINFIQISTAAVISLLVLLFFDLGALTRADYSVGLPAVAYLGVFSTCLCYFLQTYAQKFTTAAKAGIFLSTEGLFGSLFAVLLGMEPLTGAMAAGGIVILGSVILMEYSPRKR